MRLPVAPGPQGSTLLPSGRVLTVEANDQVPVIWSLRVFFCAAVSAAGRAIPRQNRAVVVKASAVRRFMIFSPCEVKRTSLRPSPARSTVRSDAFGRLAAGVAKKHAPTRCAASSEFDVAICDIKLGRQAHPCPLVKGGSELITVPIFSYVLRAMNRN